MSRWCDRIVIGGLGFLIFFTPLAFGSVHPWAFALMEAVIFFLVIVWMVRISHQPSAISHQQSAVSGQRLTPHALRLTTQLALFLGLFFVFVLFQLLPLPPAVIRVFSPATFGVYTHSLPGWVERQAPSAKREGQDARSQPSDVSGQKPAARDQRSEISGQKSEITSNSQTQIPQSAKSAIRNPQSAIPLPPVLLPTPGEVESGAPVPFEEQRSEVRDQISDIRDQTSEIRGQRSDVSGRSHGRPLTSDLRPLYFQKWLPLSLAPSRTRSDLLKLASYAALFFLVLLYPFPESREQGAESRGQRSQGKVGGKLISFFIKRRRSHQRSAVSGHHERSEGLGVRGQRSEVRGQRSELRYQKSGVSGRLLILITVSGLIIAAIGFIERFTWNGKILWFFMPYDWSGSGIDIGTLRASGPFIDPDHFANYLAMILPLALGFVIYSRYFFRKESQLGAKIFFGMTLFVAFISMLLSLSRSGWMTAVLGTGLLLWFGSARGAQTENVASGNNRLVVRGSSAIIAGLLVVSLFFVGPGAREQIDSRLHETVSADMGLAGRAALWRGSLKMIRDFPLFGVGLGSWQDLFQHYQSPPWFPTFYGEAHNDYLEILAETGIIGFILLSLFFVKAGKQLFATLRSSDDRSSKTAVVMILAAVATMTLHELFDFNLQIPANAFLFTVLLAIGVRVSVNGQRAKGEAEGSDQRSAVGSQRSEVRGQTSDVSGVKAVSRSPWSVVRALFPSVSRLTPYAVVALSVFLVVAAFTQEMTPYPYSLKMPQTVAEANDMLVAHPGLSTPHVYLLRLMEDRAPIGWQLGQVRAALWLNPNDPLVRDQYARLLLGAGNQSEALSEVSHSVFNAPYLFAHYYLSGRLLPWLSAAEKTAVESGFRKANGAGFPDAMANLAIFYEATNQYAQRGRLFEAAGGSASEAVPKAELFVEASSSYAKAGDEEHARTLLRKAMALAPKAPRPYEIMAALYGQRKEVANISGTISEGIKNGAPAFDLYLALAEAAQKAGARDESKQALSRAKDALRAPPQEEQEPLHRYYLLAETAQRLGFGDEAISALLQALEVRPSSTETLLRLANLYLQGGNFDRAAYYFRSYIEINPGAADAFYHLAVAEERQYRFAAAEAAYKRAVELAPQHDAYRQGYEALRARVAQNRKSDG